MGILPRSRSIPAWSPGALLDRGDVFCLAALLLLWFSLVALHYDALPLQFWDEGRNANNALEIARSGQWLVPSYGGVPDHYNLKPPLLIWQMSALMRLGLPPVLAVRLPTMAAALAVVGVVWGFCRYALRDRLAAAVVGFLLLSPLFYTYFHVARTGDYDVPLSFLVLCYVLAFWASIERGGRVRIGWFAVFAAGLVLAVMTKGIAGTFALVGILAFALTSGRLATLSRDTRVWLLALLAIVLCLAYYGSREQYDPGYLQAVWRNELRSFPERLEVAPRSSLYYMQVLVRSFEPTFILLPLAVMSIFGRNDRRRSMVGLCLWCAAAILVVITAAQTRLYWYATPTIPLMAIAAALGVSDGLRWIKDRESLLPWPLRATPLQVALGMVLTLTSAVTLYRNQVVHAHMMRQAEYGQNWYGALFEELQARHISRVLVLDSGREEAENYDPVLKFYAEIARIHGLAVRIAPFGTLTAAGELAATCDPRVVPLLEHQDGFVVGGPQSLCVFGPLPQVSH